MRWQIGQGDSLCIQCFIGQCFISYWTELISTILITKSFHSIQNVRMGQYILYNQNPDARPFCFTISGITFRK